MSRHRAPVRPRYGRISVLTAALIVTLIAVLGGTGLLPGIKGDEGRAAVGLDPAPTADPTPTPTPTPSPSTGPAQEASPAPDPEPAKIVESSELAIDTSLPADSGEGRRIVYSESRQRTWLVEEDGEVARTYPVSGSIYDNLDPGTFQVYSRSEDAYGIDDSGTMKYFVRFTKGNRGAAIGFHDIPIDDGKMVQTVDQLGTPLSHGCIRQEREDAIALWDFAPIGTTVVVTP